MKKNILLFFFILIVLGLLAQTAIIPALRNGTVDNPYQIATWQNLYWISAPDTVDGLIQADRWSNYYLQTADIDFADATPATNSLVNLNNAYPNPFNPSTTLSF